MSQKSWEAGYQGCNNSDRAEQENFISRAHTSIALNFFRAGKGVDSRNRLQD